MKKLILLGTADSIFEPPYDDNEYEIWATGTCFGKAHTDIKRIDMGFEIHDANIMKSEIELKGIDYNKYGNIPIMVQDANDEYTKSIINNPITFPIKELLEYTNTSFFTSTFCYMFTYAAMMGYKEIYFYKMLLSSGGEYFLERPGLEYWIERLGFKEKITVHFPEDCELFANHDILYGYQQRPNIYKMKSFFKHLWGQLHNEWVFCENDTANINKKLGAIEMYHIMKNNDEELIKKILDKTEIDLKLLSNSLKEHKEKYLQYFGGLQVAQYNYDRAG